MSQEVPEILVCPLSKTKLRREGDFLVSEAGYKYPIKDGIPILLPTAAIAGQPANPEIGVPGQAAAGSCSESSQGPTQDRGNKPE